MLCTAGANLEKEGGLLMTIKEICERTGLSQDTIRYYEKAGVIPNVSRSCGGTRCYSEEDLEWVQTAVCLRNAGISVARIAAYVQLIQQGDETFEARLQLLREERDKIRTQKMSLERTLSLLDYKIGKYEEAIRTGTLIWDEEVCEKYAKQGEENQS